MDSCWHIYNYGTNYIGKECIFSWGTQAVITIGITSTTLLIILTLIIIFLKPWRQIE